MGGAAKLNRMQNKEKIVEFVFAKRLHWAEMALFLVLGISILSRNLAQVSFHPDESDWIHESRFLGYFLQGNFDHELWRDDDFGYANMPVTKYVIGIAMAVGQQDQNSFPKWNWLLSDAENLAQGHKPPDEILWWARIPMVLISSIGLVAAAYLLARSHSRLSAWMFYLLGMFHFSYLMQRAMNEPVLVLWTFLAALIGWRGLIAIQQKEDGSALGWFAIYGLLSGLAAATKLNGIMLIPAGVLLVAIPILRQDGFQIRALIARATRPVAVLSLMGIITFLAVNPLTYSNPIVNTIGIFKIRSLLLNIQTQRLPDHAITAANWLERMPGQIFGDFVTPPYPFGWAINLALFIAGCYFVTRAFWKQLPGGDAALVLILFALTCAGPALFSPLSWDRYYLFPVLFARMFMAAGLAGLLSRLITQEK